MILLDSLEKKRRVMYVDRPNKTTSRMNMLLEM